MSSFRKSRLLPMAVLSLAWAINLPAQTCSTQEFDATKVVFQNEALPIEQSGFFPYLPQGGDANDESPAQKYSTEQWSGTGNCYVPACTCFTAYGNMNWSGSWVFSKADFSNTSSKLVALESGGCGGVGLEVTEHLKIGLDFGGLFGPALTEVQPTARAAHRPNDPNLGSCNGGIYFYNTNVSEALSDAFTLEEGKSRAEAFKTVSYGGNGLQLWENSSPRSAGEAARLIANGVITRTAPIACHAARVSFQVQFCEPCLGHGKFLVTYYYKRWPLGQAEPATYETDTEEVEFKDPPYLVPQVGYKPYKFDLKQGEQCKLVRVTARKMCEQGKAGDGSGKVHSLDMFYQLGKRADGNTAGGLEVRADAISPVLYTPAMLQLIASNNSGIGVLRQSGVLRQMKVPEAFVDIVTLTPSSYEIRFYLLSQVGAFDSGTGLYPITGQPYVKHLIENPDAASPNVTNRIRFTETGANGQRVTVFSYDSATDTMAMATGNGLRTESLKKVTAGSDVTETRIIKNADDQIDTVTQEIKHQFPFGLNMVDRILDPAGAALTTHSTYYENYATDGGGYGQVKLVTEPSGRWTSYTYDVLGRPADTVTQFLNSAVDSAASQNRLSSSSWTTVADLDGDGLPETLSTTIDSLLGKETGRSFELIYSKPQTFKSQTVEVRAQIRAVTLGAAWNATDNLMTLTRSIQGGVLGFKPMSMLTPDQILTLYQYDLTTSSLTTTAWSGQPNATKDAVISGTKTVTTTDLFGHLLSSSTSDIASTLTLSAQTVTMADPYGRPIRIDFDDGTYELRSYACCGLGSVTDRTGATTSYGYDDLGRVKSTVHAGILTLTTYDGNGRVLTISRKGSDNSIITQQTNKYDLAGRQISTKDALNRPTLFAEVKNSAGNTVRTTTTPDNGTRISTSLPDGSLLSVTGNASARQLGYEYGVAADGAFTKEIRLGAAGETTEWIKTFSDFAGRSFKTVYADGATEQNYYNALGQLVKTTDADGVTTLFGYNLRGEQEVTALDLNRDGVIDYTGADRVTRTLSEVATHGTFTVQRRTTQVWETDGQNTPTTVSISEQSVDGLRTWQTLRGLSASSVTTLNGAGSRTVVSTAPDATFSTQVFADDRLQSSVTTRSSLGTLLSATYGYDAHGRLQSVTDARTGATTYSYYVDDQVHTVTTPDPDTTRSGDGYDAQTTTYAYDEAGRQNLVTLPDNGLVNTTYWPTGAVKRTWGSRTYPTEYTYDAQGRVKMLTTWQDFASDAGKAVTTWNYNSLRGWLDNKRYADNTGPAYTYKLSGRLLTRTWVRGAATTYGYNNAGDLSGVTYSDATPAVALTFDRAGRAKTMSDGSGTRTLSYHASGQLEDELYSAGLLNGFSVERDYDSLSRLATVSTANGSPLSAYSYAYDAASRLRTVTQGTNVATYSYVANSPLVQTITFAQGGTTRLTTTKSYDSLNRLSSISSAPYAGSVLNYVYSYNTANQRTKATREDNTSWNYSYDALGQVTAGQKKRADNSTILGQDLAWTYDDIGNRSSASRNASSAETLVREDYTPNALNQYASRTLPAIAEAFGTAASDAVVTVNAQPTQRQGGNWYASLPYTNAYEGTWVDLAIKGVRAGAGPGGTDAVASNTRHVWLPKSPEVYTYDADGNLTADGRWSYAWDAENRLAAMETRSDLLPPFGLFPLTQKRRVEFGYDGQSRRVSKKVFNWSPGGWVLAQSNLFLYDGWNLIAELNQPLGTSNLILGASFTWGLDLSGSIQGAGGVGGLLFSTFNTQPSTYASAYDGNGNVIGLVDMATGAKSATYDYNAFGETIQSDGVASIANHFRFSTKYADDETGLLYYGFRYYQSGAGRWLSRDPIKESGGVNLYGMVANQAVERWDFLGLKFKATAGACRPGDPCFENANRLLEWARELIDRSKELRDPIWMFLARNNHRLTPGQYKNPRIDTSRKAWLTHVQQWSKALAQTSNCVAIVLEQMANKECGCDDPDAKAWVEEMQKEVERQAGNPPLFFVEAAPVFNTNWGGLESSGRFGGGFSENELDILKIVMIGGPAVALAPIIAPAAAAGEGIVLLGGLILAQ